MKPVFNIELDERSGKIQKGSLVTNNAKLGFVNKRVNNDYYVFNIKLAIMEMWKIEKTKLFKGKITIEQ